MMRLHAGNSPWRGPHREALLAQQGRLVLRRGGSEGTPAGGGGGGGGIGFAGGGGGGQVGGGGGGGYGGGGGGGGSDRGRGWRFLLRLPGCDQQFFGRKHAH